MGSNPTPSDDRQGARIGQDAKSPLNPSGVRRAPLLTLAIVASLTATHAVLVSFAQLEPAAWLLGITRDGLLHYHVWTYLTYAFIHGSWTHLALNATFITVLGYGLEPRIGRSRMALLCAGSAVAGGILIGPYLDVGPVIGASAAGSGLAACMLVALLTRDPQDDAPSPLHHRGYRLLAWAFTLLAVLEIALLFFGASITGLHLTQFFRLMSEGNLGAVAHAGGAFAGLALGVSVIMCKGRFGVIARRAIVGTFVALLLAIGAAGTQVEPGPAYFVDRAMTLLRHGKAREAKALMDKALAEFPKSHGCYLALSLCYDRLGDADQRRQVLLQGLHFSPADFDRGGPISFEGVLKLASQMPPRQIRPSYARELFECGEARLASGVFDATAFEIAEYLDNGPPIHTKMGLVVDFQSEFPTLFDEALKSLSDADRTAEALWEAVLQELDRVGAKTRRKDLLDSYEAIRGRIERGS